MINNNFALQKNKKILDYLSILSEHKEYLHDKFKVKEIGIFGSAVRGEDTDVSDIDILVEYEENIRRTLFDEARLIGELKDILREQHIDLAVKKNLNRHYKDNILKEVIYA
jgi:hypothetical protein